MSRALLAGSTGLIGGHLLDRLLAGDDYDLVTALTRRSLERSDPRLEELRVEFDRLDEVFGERHFDDAFCSLGTTIRSAGSQLAFERVDFDYVVGLAEAAARHGARRFFLVSAMGADPESGVFYNRVKGRAERAVCAMGFDAVHLFRPSLLLGDRREFRPVEKLMTPVARLLGPLLPGTLRRYRPIHADAVAEAMLAAARGTERGEVIHYFHDPD